MLSGTDIKKLQEKLYWSVWPSQLARPSPHLSPHSNTTKIARQGIQIHCYLHFCCLTLILSPESVSQAIKYILRQRTIAHD